MATYQITKSDGNPGPAIADAASPDTQTDLQLVGQNAVSYGLDVATSFYWLLENFASSAAPAGPGARQTGQLWYDKTGSAETLNVYNGATWDQIANTNRGAGVTSGTLRWDNASNTWAEDVRVQIDGSGTLTLVGATTGSVAITHSSTTNLDIDGAATTTDITVGGTIVTVNLPSLTLTTELDETYGGTGLTSYVAGDVLYASGSNTLAKLPIGANGEVLTLSGGLPSWGSAGGTGTVTSSGAPLVTEVAVFSTGTNILSDSTFTWDGSTMFATNVTGTNIGGITSTDLVDKSDTEIIAGAWSFTNVQPIVASAGDIDATNGFGFVTTDAGVAAAIRADTGTTEIQFTHSGTPDWNITGLGIILADNAIHATSIASAASFRSIGDAAGWSGADSYISFYDNASVHGLQIGTLNGSSASVVNSRSGDLELSASNNLALDLTSTTSTMYQAGSAAMQWRAVSGTNTTTSASVYDDGNSPRNVGFNETPEVIVASAVTVDANDIGKFLRRSASTSRVITLSADTDIPIGGSFVAHNDHTTGTLTIATTQTLEWIDGSDSAPSTGTRTIAYNSVVTCRKKSSTVWQIWGNGIS